MMGAVCRLASRVLVTDVVVNLSSRQRVCSSQTRRTVGPTSLLTGVLFFSFFSVSGVGEDSSRENKRSSAADARLCISRYVFHLSDCVLCVQLAGGGGGGGGVEASEGTKGELHEKVKPGNTPLPDSTLYSGHEKRAQSSQLAAEPPATSRCR